MRQRGLTPGDRSGAPREREVYALVRAGVSPKRIGHQLEVARSTVYSYLTGIAEKLRGEGRPTHKILTHDAGRDGQRP